MGVKKVLLLLGGTRIGDTISATSGFRLLQEKYGDVHWCHGAFAAQCFDLFEETDLPLAKHCMVPEAVLPEDVYSVDLWRGFVDLRDYPDYDLYLDFETGLFLHASNEAAVFQQFACGVGFGLWDAAAPQLTLKGSIEQGDYLCVQGATVSDWKSVPALGEVTFPAEARELGWKNEPYLLDAEDYKGLSLLESARQLAGCRMFVGVCSSMAILSAALGVPTLQLHFDDQHVAPNGLSQHYSKCYDLIQPDKDQLQTAIDQMWEAQ